MRRLNKRIQRYVGMYGTMSQERYDSLFLKNKEKKDKKENALPKPKPVSRPSVKSTAPAATPNMAAFENEYKNFIANLKKQKEEKEAAKAAMPIVEEKVEPTPVFEVPSEAAKAVAEENTVDDLKTALDEATNKIEETITTSEVEKPRRRKRKKTAELA